MKYHLPKLRGRQTNFSRPFQPCVQVFRERGKVYPNKTYLLKRCFGTLFHSCMFDFASKGEGWGGRGGGRTLMKLSSDNYAL